MSESSSRIVEATYKTPQISEWERFRALITRLYKEEQLPLKKVMSILSEQHGFQATSDMPVPCEERRLTEDRQRQYKQRILAWSLQKNVKSEDIDDLLGQYTKEELQNLTQTGCESSLIVKGRKLSLSLVKRYIRRLRQSETSAGPSASLSPGARSNRFISAPPGTIHPSQDAQTEKVDGHPTVQTHASMPSWSWIYNVSAPGKRAAYHGVQRAGSCDVRLSSPCNLSDEPLSTDLSCHGYDQEENDGRRKRRKISPKNVASLETQALACPFYKHNPQRYNPQNEDMNSAIRYRTCAGPGWETISRLRQHLFRAHVAPVPFGACHSGCQSESDLGNHLQECGGTVEVDPTSMSESISEDQKDILKQKQPPGLTREEAWMRIYHVLFPHDSSTPSPYYQSDKTMIDRALPTQSFAQLDSLIQHLSQMLPQEIVTKLQAQPELLVNTTLTETSIGLARESTHDRSGNSSPVQNAQATKADKSQQPSLSRSTQNLKALISECVSKTCSEWLATHKEQDEQDEQDDDPDQEPENDKEQSHSTGTLTHEQHLSPSLIWMPDHGIRYPVARQELDFTAPNFWPSSLDQPGSRCAPDLDMSSEPSSIYPYSFFQLSMPSATQSWVQSIAPDTAISNHLESPDHGVFGSSWGINFPSSDWRSSWGLPPVPAEVPTTLPETNQNP